MKNFKKKLESLFGEMTNKVCDLILEKGVESKHNSEKCLKIKDDELMFNLEGSRYLEEIKLSGYGTMELVDNSGYSYHYTALEAENLCQVIDHLVEEYEG